MSAFVDRALLASHARVESVLPILFAGSLRRAIVAHENQQRVVAQVVLVELLQQSAKVLVKILNHPIERGTLRFDPLLLEWVGITIGNQVGTVHRIGWKVNEERLFGFLLDEVHHFIEPDVGAVSVERFRRSVSIVGVVEVIIAGRVSDFVCPARHVTNHGFKTSFARCKWWWISQMPLAEQAGPISRVAKNFGHGCFVGIEQLAAFGDRPRTHSRAVAARHQCGSRGCANRIDMKVFQSHTLRCEPIQVGCVEPRVAVA